MGGAKTLQGGGAYGGITDTAHGSPGTANVIAANSGGAAGTSDGAAGRSAAASGSRREHKNKTSRATPV